MCSYSIPGPHGSFVVYRAALNASLPVLRAAASHGWSAANQTLAHVPLWSCLFHKDHPRRAVQAGEEEL